MGECINNQSGSFRILYVTVGYHQSFDRFAVLFFFFVLTARDHKCGDENGPGNEDTISASSSYNQETV